MILASCGYLISAVDSESQLKLTPEVNPIITGSSHYFKLKQLIGPIVANSCVREVSRIEAPSVIVRLRC